MRRERGKVSDSEDYGTKKGKKRQEKSEGKTEKGNRLKVMD